MCLGWGRHVIQTEFWWLTPSENSYLEDRGDGRITLKLFFWKLFVRLMELAQDRVQWQALVLTVLNLRLLIQHVN